MSTQTIPLSLSLSHSLSGPLGLATRLANEASWASHPGRLQTESGTARTWDGDTHLPTKQRHSTEALFKSEITLSSKLNGNWVKLHFKRDSITVGPQQFYESIQAALRENKASWERHMDAVTERKNCRYRTRRFTYWQIWGSPAIKTRRDTKEAQRESDTSMRREKG